MCCAFALYSYLSAFFADHRKKDGGAVLCGTALISSSAHSRHLIRLTASFFKIFLYTTFAPVISSGVPVATTFRCLLRPQPNDIVGAFYDVKVVFNYYHVVSGVATSRLSTSISLLTSSVWKSGGRLVKYIDCPSGRSFETQFASLTLRLAARKGGCRLTEAS